MCQASDSSVTCTLEVHETFLKWERSGFVVHNPYNTMVVRDLSY